MAYIAETSASRAGEEGVETQSRELTYLVQLGASETPLDGYALVQTYAPATLDGYSLQGIAWRPNPDSSAVVEYTAKYSNKEPRKPELQPGEGEFVFDTTGGREKIWYSKETMNRYGTAEATTPPDFKGGINVTKSGVGGIDIVVPNFKFSIERKLTLAQMSSGLYVQTLFDLTGKVNNDQTTLTYKGLTLTFKRRELLFLGARGSQRGNESFTLRYEFHGSAEGVNLVIGGGTVGEPNPELPTPPLPAGGIPARIIPLKRGWDYLWVGFDTRTDTDSHTIIDLPTSAHIERVYDEGNFEDLLL